MTSAQIRQVREAMGLTKSEFARALGTSPSNVTRWEAGDPPLQGANYRALILLHAKHVHGPETITEAETTLAALLNVSAGEAASLLIRHRKADSETWTRAVARIAHDQERRRQAALAAG